MKHSKHEHRRLRLLDLLSAPPYEGRGGKAKLAKASGLDASYVSRLTWEPARKGSKNMGEDVAETIEKACKIRGWFSAPLGTHRDQLRASEQAEGPASADDFIRAGATPADLARTIARLSDALARMLAGGKP